MYRSEGVVNCRRGGRSTATQSQLVVELRSRESSSQTRGTEELSRSSNLSQDGLHNVRGSRREKKIDSSLERYRRTRFSLAQESSVKKGKGAAISHGSWICGQGKLGMSRGWRCKTNSRKRRKSRHSKNGVGSIGLATCAICFGRVRQLRVREQSARAYK
ncbi:hypothetical protein B296_00003839 [Ensete ventricosum]|uniref:Uncharacterized protein n=1 Tax=Ensete ventricosum TaxID=4639 RepID=A0A427ADI2_ENSVE|nr:hypothetical protein B296_00003839 [Ensete ventricosum]